MSSEENGNENRYNWALYNLLTVIAIGFFIVIGIVTNAITMTMMMELVSEFGLPGVVLVLWYLTDKGNRKVLAEYKADMEETRQMYKNNVHLVEKYERMASDLHDVVIMNTTAMTHLADKIPTN